jgi:hypothetical protein
VAQRPMLARALLSGKAFHGVHVIPAIGIPSRNADAERVQLSLAQRHVPQLPAIDAVALVTRPSARTLLAGPLGKRAQRKARAVLDDGRHNKCPVAQARNKDGHQQGLDLVAEAAVRGKCEEALAADVVSVHYRALRRFDIRGRPAATLLSARTGHVPCSPEHLPLFALCTRALQ